MRKPWRSIGLVAALLTVGAARGEEPAAVPVDGPPRVSLDRLFKLPNDPVDVPQQPERRVAGATRAEWEERFNRARMDLAEAHVSLKKAQAELEELAAKADAWQLTAPGAQVTPENSPVSFKLRQDIRRFREDIETYEAALTELKIEANLAGVPAAWQQPPAQSSEAQDRLVGSKARPGSAKRAVSAK